MRKYKVQLGIGTSHLMFYLWTNKNNMYLGKTCIYNYHSQPLVFRILTIVDPQMIKINFFEHMFNEHLFLVKMSR